MLHDIRYALRVLRRSPGFAALAVVTLALGIATTVTVFSAADTVLIRPMSTPARASSAPYLDSPVLTIFKVCPIRHPGGASTA